MLPYTIDDLEHVIDHTYLMRGKRYLNSGHVLNTSLSPDGSHITGQVRGTRRQP